MQRNSREAARGGPVVLRPVKAAPNYQGPLYPLTLLVGVTFWVYAYMTNCIWCIDEDDDDDDNAVLQLL